MTSLLQLEQITKGVGTNGESSQNEAATRKTHNQA